MVNQTKNIFENAMECNTFTVSRDMLTNNLIKEYLWALFGLWRHAYNLHFVMLHYVVLLGNLSKIF